MYLRVLAHPKCVDPQSSSAMVHWSGLNHVKKGGPYVAIQDENEEDKKFDSSWKILSR